MLTLEADIRARLAANTKGYTMYRARREEYASNSDINFRVSPNPLRVSTAESEELTTIGADVSSFFQAVDELYRTDGELRSVLDKGKPEIFLTEAPSRHLFIRPDLIVTDAGFAICEIETSPFGLALAHVLNSTYEQDGNTTLVDSTILPEYIQKNTPAAGRIVYSDKTASYSGQMTFLANEVFGGRNRAWSAQNANAAHPEDRTPLYRGFYLSEHETNPHVRALLEGAFANSVDMLPSPTPHLEEKALLAVLWDTRWQDTLRKRLGNAAFNHLMNIIPPTWIVGEEEFFAPGLPQGMSKSIDLASLSRSKRTLVLKPSGFSNNSSWAEGVVFLHEKSGEKAREALASATKDPSTRYVIQEFRKGEKRPFLYYDGDRFAQMFGKIRITPYYEPGTGKLISIKATACENTDRLHGSSSSINVAVA